MPHPHASNLDLDDPASPRARALVAWGNAAVAARLHDATFAAARARLRAIVEAEDRLIVGRSRSVIQDLCLRSLRSGPPTIFGRVMKAMCLDEMSCARGDVTT